MNRATKCPNCNHNKSRHRRTYPGPATSRCDDCPCGWPYNGRHGTGCPRGVKTYESMALGPAGCICGLETP